LRGQILKGDARTLDAGCGNGAFSVYAARCGNGVVAVSFSSHEQENARRRAAMLGVEGIDFRLINLYELSEHAGELGNFDQVICLETIEHLNDDAGLLCALAAMLRPAGRLLITTPFEGHHPLYREQRHPSGVDDGSHVRYGYTQERLRSLVEATGLRVTNEGFVSGFTSQKVTSLMRWLTERLGMLPAWTLMLPLRALVVFDRPISRALHYPYLCVALTAERTHQERCL
jgi:cyclopropane fatty-acyl-phospholipid synthase-like methyltransferase